MFAIELPYDIGTFVKITEPLFERKKPLLCGTIVGYSVFGQTDITIFVSGYKEPWCGEYMLSEIEIMDESEIKKLKERYDE